MVPTTPANTNWTFRVSIHEWSKESSLRLRIAAILATAALASSLGTAHATTVVSDSLGCGFTGNTSWAGSGASAYTNAVYSCAFAARVQMDYHWGSWYQRSAVDGVGPAYAQDSVSLADEAFTKHQIYVSGAWRQIVNTWVP